MPVDEYLDGVRRELEFRARDRGWSLETLYLGGGTPSRLGGEGVARLLDLIRTRAELTPGAELTVEANPDDVTQDAARAWREAGVNRVSLGVQTFHQPALEWMHRTHDTAAGAAAVGELRSAGIDSVSVDLIFALPDSLGRSWERDLELALDLQPSHLSLYGLTVEPATPLFRWIQRGDVQETSEERYAEDFLMAHRAVTAAGLEHYEVSNFGRPGHRSRHNSSYWRHVPYAALGPGAHGYDGERRSWNAPSYAQWLNLLREGKDPSVGSETLGRNELDAERVYLGLRTSDGLRLRAREREVVAEGGWESAGWAELDGDRLRLTPAGWLRLDSLAAVLTAKASH